MNAILEHTNSVGSAFVEFALPMLLQSSILIIILLALDFLIKKKVRAVFRYCLWMLVLVKLILPTTLSVPTGLGYWFGEQLPSVEWSDYAPAVDSQTDYLEPYPEFAPSSVEQSPETTAAVPQETKTSSSSPLPKTSKTQMTANVTAGESKQGTYVTNITWQGALFVVWAMVVIVMFLLLLQRLIFVLGLIRQAKEGNNLMNETLDYCRKRMHLKTKVRLKVSANATSPAVCGLLRPVILVPQNLAPSLGPSHLRTVLLHELAHIKRGDLWVNLVQTLLQIIYFYNPLLWLANAIIRRVREQAVDETVQAAMGEKAKQYPETLLNVAKLAFGQPALSLRLVGVVESKSALKTRIKRMLNRPIPKSAKVGLVGLIAIVIIGAVLLPMAKAENFSAHAQQIMDLAEQEARQLNHEYIGTEHILLALAKDERGVSGIVLKNLGIDENMVRLEVLKIVKSGSSPAAARKLPKTPRTERAMEYAIEESRILNHGYIGAEHILLGLLREENSVAAGVLMNLGLRLEDVRREVLRVVGTKPEKGGCPTLVIKGTVTDAETSEPIAGVKVGDDGYSGGRQWTTTDSDGTYYFLTWPEHHSIKAQANGYTSKSESLYSGHFTFNKEMVEEVFDFELEPVESQKRSEFTATLPNGVTVELVGLGKNPWESEQVWWRPNGVEIEKPEFKVNEPPHKWPKDPNRLQFECAALLRFSNHLGKDVSVPEVKCKNRLLVSGLVSRIADDGSQITYIVSNPFEGEVPNKADISLAVGTEPFKEAKTPSKKLNEEQYEIYGLEGGLFVVRHPLRMSSMGTPAVDLTCPKGDIEFRVTAELKNGQINQWHGGSVGEEVKFFQATPKRENTKIEDIKELIIEYRPYEWLTFKNVSLKPNFKTDVQIEVEKSVTKEESKAQEALNTKAEVFGRVTKEGAPRSNARIITRAYSNNSQSESDSPLISRETRSDQKGNYHIDNLPSGDLSVSVMSAVGNLNVAQKNLKLMPAQKLELNFGDEPGYLVTGTITLDDEPVELAGIDMTPETPEDNSFTKWGWTDKDGHFRITGLPNGTYRAFIHYDTGLDPETFLWSEGESFGDFRKINIDGDLTLDVSFSSNKAYPNYMTVQVEGEERVLHFPKDCSMGLVHVGELRTLDPLWWQGWEAVGQAKGDVRVPLNKAVRLDISTEASEDISPLATLGSDDIQAISFSWNRCNIDDSDLEHLSGLTGLKHLELSSTQIEGPGLVHLSGLKSLEKLGLSSTKIDDDGLKYIARLKSLKRLDLSSTKVTDAGLVHLRNLSSLERISLGSTGISGKGFSSITDTTSINTLRLNHSDITDEGLKHIAKLKSLERLFLVNTAISDTGIEHISRLKALKELDLSTFGASKMKLSGVALSHIAKLTSIESLKLPGGITDADLAKLEGLTGLKRLDIGRMQLTGVGIQTLKEFKLLEYLQCPQGVSDEDLTAIKDLNSLEELWIQNSPISNDGIANLSNLKSLKKLGLHNGRPDRNMKATGSCLVHLKELPSLTSLWLSRLELDDSRLTYLAELTQLEELEISQMPLRDEDLVNLSKLTNLKRLDFDSDTVSDGGIAYLASLTALEDLTPWISMTDVGLSYLANMNKLERLQINGDFTDEGLSHLERLKALRSLRITSRNDFSPAKLEQLQKELPVLQTFNVNKSRETKSRPEIGEVAPKFSLKILDEKEIKLEDYSGKVVLLYFWGTWCSPCVASTPGLKKLFEELSQYDGFAMIALAIDNDEFRLRRHIEQYGLTWPQVRLGLHSQVAADYGISGVPAYILIGPDGKVLLSQERDWDKIKAIVAKTLGASKNKKPAVQVEGKKR